MNTKTMTAFACAFALACSAFADAPNWLSGGTLSAWPTVTDAVGGAWDNVEYATYNSDKAALEVETDDTGALTFAATTPKELGAGTLSATFTSEIEFNAFDAGKEPTVDQSAKAGVIVVNNGGAYSYYVLAKDSVANSNVWTEFASATLGAPVTVSVKIEEAGNSLKDVTYTIGETTQTLTVYNVDNTLSTASYAGSGYVASFGADAEAQTIKLDIDSMALGQLNAQVKEVQVNGVKVEETDYSTIPYGAKVEVFFDGTNNNMIKGTKSAVYPSTSNIAISGLPEGAEVVAAAAKLDGEKYETFAEAYAAATGDGTETITLCQDLDVIDRTTITIEKSIVLNLGGKTVASKIDKAEQVNDYIFDIKNCTVSIANGVIKRCEAVDQRRMTGTMIRVSGSEQHPARLTMLANTTVQNLGNESADISWDAVSASVSVRDYAQFIMNGGLIDNAVMSSEVEEEIVQRKYAINTRGSGTATINGGVIKGIPVQLHDTTQANSIIIPTDSTAKFEYNPIDDTTRAYVSIQRGYGMEPISGGEYDGYYQIAALTLHTLSYKPNGGTGTAPQSVDFYKNDTGVAAVANTFTYEGYEFAGWNTQADGQGTAYAVGDAIALGDADIELFAQWTAVPQGIVFTIAWDEFTGAIQYKVGAGEFQPLEKGAGSSWTSESYEEGTVMTVTAVPAEGSKLTSAAEFTLNGESPTATFVGVTIPVTEQGVVVGDDETGAQYGITNPVWATESGKGGKLQKAVSWATTKGTIALLNSAEFAQDGTSANPAADAYLLNCSTDELADAKKAFKVSSITVDAEGNVTVGTPEGTFNGTIQKLGKSAIDAKEEWGVAVDTDTVFKLQLVK